MTKAGNVGCNSMSTPNGVSFYVYLFNVLCFRGVSQVCNFTAPIYKFLKTRFCQRDIFGMSCYWLVFLIFLFSCFEILFHLFFTRFSTLLCNCVGFLALTCGSGNNAREILKDSIVPLSQALKSGSESSKIPVCIMLCTLYILSPILCVYQMYYNAQLCVFLLKFVNDCSYWSVWLLSLLLVAMIQSRQRDQCKLCGK